MIFSPKQVCSGITRCDPGAEEFKILHLSVHLSTRTMGFRPFTIYWEFTASHVCEDSGFFSWKEKRDWCTDDGFSFVVVFYKGKVAQGRVSEVLFQGDFQLSVVVESPRTLLSFSNLLLSFTGACFVSCLHFTFCMFEENSKEQSLNSLYPVMKSSERLADSSKSHSRSKEYNKTRNRDHLLL